MRARQVQKACQLEVEHLNKMKVVERVPYSFVKHRTGKEPIKARWVPRSKLVAKEFRRGSKIDGFTNFSATPPLELVKLMISVAATAQWDQAARFVQEGTREQLRDRDDAHRHQQSVLSRSKQRIELC